MNILRNVFIGSALTCAGAWLLKQPLIAATGGAETDHVMVGVLWGAGALALVVTGATGAALLARRAPAWARVLLAMMGAALAFVAMSLLDAAVKAVYTSDGWFRDEIALVVLAVVVGALGLRLAQRSEPSGA